MLNYVWRKIVRIGYFVIPATAIFLIVLAAGFLGFATVALIAGISS